jgi:hypothetical protein
VVFSGYYGSSTNKPDRHDITDILLEVALNTIKPTNQPTNIQQESKMKYHFMKRKFGNGGQQFYQY